MARRLRDAKPRELVVRAQRERPVSDPDLIAPATRQETLPIAMLSLMVALLSLLICYSRGYLLLYGDAVAHLGIARRILDSRNPGLAQLGGVWLPLPHLLMLPFVQKLSWWQNGFAGVWPSVLCYIVGNAGFYRLARRLLVPRWALVSTAFYAFNPNLLYLATTAMTEPLFLALLVWLTLLTLECLDAIALDRPKVVSNRLLWIAVVIFASVFTRYDGWIIGAVVWLVLAIKVLAKADLRRRVTPAFVVFTLITVAGPLLWLAYNQHFMHDALDFMRGPYSAAAIERKTSPPGSKHYRGWHNIGWALIFYTRTAQVDAAAWETGFLLLLVALAGVYLLLSRRFEAPKRAALLLWLPLPFYLYSIAYGSVPIFIPQLYPHSYYNARYGMELLPALALFPFLAVAAVEHRWAKTRRSVTGLAAPLALVLVAANTAVMIYFVPLVLKEGIVNATTRVPFEAAIARQLESLPSGVPILMYNSDHIGALETAGIPLRQTISESDRDSFDAALADPAAKALYIVAIAGDPVAKAVTQHPENLTELSVLCTTGQPCARIYKSDKYGIMRLQPQR